jgi:hypothetical protein
VEHKLPIVVLFLLASVGCYGQFQVPIRTGAPAGSGSTPVCGDPTPTPPNLPGTYTVPPTVLPLSIGYTSPTTGCSMHMTLDGSTPTCSSTAYSGQSISSTTTFGVIACQGGFTSSNPVINTWTIVSSGFLSAGVIATTRAADWTKAGVVTGSINGIPPESGTGAWTQCGSTIAAYGSPGSPGSISTITNAINSCSGSTSTPGAGEYVKLGPGDFYLDTTTLTHPTHVELRGSGPASTRLHFSSFSDCNGGSCLFGMTAATSNFIGGPGTIAQWTAGYAQGSNQITISDGSLYAAGNIYVLDQCDTGTAGDPCSGSAVDNGNYYECEVPVVWSGTFYSSPFTGCSYTDALDGAMRTGGARQYRGQEEFVEATSCTNNGGTCGVSGQVILTLTHGLVHPNWATSSSPELWVAASVPATWVGIRDLTIDASNFTANNTATCSNSVCPISVVRFSGASYFWADNVELISPPNQGFTAAFVPNVHGAFQSNYVYDGGQGWDNDSSQFNINAEDMLVANNICQQCHIAVVNNGANVENVYIGNLFIMNQDGTGNLYDGIRMNHSSGNDYHLYEQNYIESMVFNDQAHGVALVDTYYRNFITGWEPCANAGLRGNPCGTNSQKTDNVFPEIITSSNRYHNYVDNVMGTPGIHNAGAYEIDGASASGCGLYTGNFWYIGGDPNGGIWNLGGGNINGPTCGGYPGGPITNDPVLLQTQYRWANWNAFNNATVFNTSEVPSSAPGGVLNQPVPTSTCTNNFTVGCPASFYYISRPGWWASSVPFPAIGADVSGGNIGQCGGTLNQNAQFAGVAAPSSTYCASQPFFPTAWGGHVNALPAMNCALSLGMPIDGSGPALAFNGVICYGTP